MYLNGIFLMLGFGVAWYWAKTHYAEEAKKDMDYKLNQIAKTSPKELEANIQKAKDAYLKAHGTHLDFKPPHQIANDPAGSWYLSYLKLKDYQSLLRKNGWKRED